MRSKLQRRSVERGMPEQDSRLSHRHCNISFLEQGLVFLQSNFVHLEFARAPRNACMHGADVRLHLHVSNLGIRVGVASLCK